MPKMSTLKAYVLGCDGDTEVTLTSSPEDTDHIDGDFIAMDTVLEQLRRIEEEAGISR
jgi:hypothetical protein